MVGDAVCKWSLPLTVKTIGGSDSKAHVAAAAALNGSDDEGRDRLNTTLCLYSTCCTYSANYTTPGYTSDAMFAIRLMPITSGAVCDDPITDWEP